MKTQRKKRKICAVFQSHADLLTWLLCPRCPALSLSLPPLSCTMFRAEFCVQVNFNLISLQLDGWDRRVRQLRSSEQLTSRKGERERGGTGEEREREGKCTPTVRTGRRFNCVRHDSAQNGDESCTSSGTASMGTPTLPLLPTPLCDFRI